MLKALRRAVAHERFFPGLLGLVLNPLHISRRGLATGVQRFASRFTGDVLDFGCGSKPYRAMFNRCTSYVGLDISVSGHNHADSQVDVFYDGKVIPFPDCHFDGIVTFETLEHVFTLDAILKELYRVLRPDGLLLVSVPFAWDEHEVPYDFARYTSFGLAHVLKIGGFEVIEIYKTNTFVLAVSQLFIEYISKNVAPSGGLFRSLFKLLVLCPMTVLAYALDAVLPKRDSYYSNCMVLARRAPT